MEGSLDNVFWGVVCLSKVLLYVCVCLLMTRLSQYDEWRMKDGSPGVRERMIQLLIFNYQVSPPKTKQLRIIQVYPHCSVSTIRRLKSMATSELECKYSWRHLVWILCFIRGDVSGRLDICILNIKRIPKTSCSQIVKSFIYDSATFVFNLSISYCKYICI